jgi:hypothetical protein
MQKSYDCVLAEWVTPDLMSQLQSNPVIAQGLMSKKCSVALTLMQQDPQEAKRRFENDPEVSLFMREFGKVMSGHFDALGNATNSSSSSGNSKPTSVENAISNSNIQEVGPLHADVLKRNKEMASKETKDTPVSDTQVQEVTNHSTVLGHLAHFLIWLRAMQVLKDPELREMLMDPSLQRILQECGDPVLFQRHMRDPATAAKIRKLYASGLVGTAK